MVEVVKLIDGSELLGTVGHFEREGFVRITKPVMLKTTYQANQMGFVFVPFMPHAKKDVFDIPTHAVLLICEAGLDISNKYNELVGGIVTAKPGIVTP